MGLLSKAAKKVNKNNKQFVSKNLDISQQVFEILSRKGWKQKELAEKLNKQESEVSKLLSGLHNLTLRSITQMEVVLEEDIIVTPQKSIESLFKGKCFSVYDLTKTSNSRSEKEHIRPVDTSEVAPIDLLTVNYGN